MLDGSVSIEGMTVSFVRPLIEVLFESVDVGVPAVIACVRGNSTGSLYN